MKLGWKRLMEALGICGDSLGCSSYPPVVMRQRRPLFVIEVGETIRGMSLRRKRITIRVEVIALGVAYGNDRYNGSGPHGIALEDVECVLADDVTPTTWEDVDVESTA